MENFSYHIPFYVVNQGVATSGHSSDLSGGQVGLFDRATFSVATAIGNGKEFFFAQGPIGGLDWYGNATSVSHKSPFFYGKDVEDIYLSKPQRLRNEEWVIGYNGSPSSVGLRYVKGEPIRFHMYFHGNPTYRFFNGPKQYVISHTPGLDCDVPCTGSDCPEGVVDCLTETKAWINDINNNVELRKFGVTAKLVTNTYSAAATAMIKYCLEICDNGTNVDLLAVQAQAPVGSVVERTSRDGATSTYQICIEDDEETTPADFQQSNSVLAAVCDECPSGSFLIEAKDVFIIRRPIVGGEDFSTAASRDTYANVVWSDYATAESITTSTTTTSTTTAAGTFNADATFIANDGAVAIVKVKFPEGTELTAIGADIIEFSHTEAAVCVFDAPAAVAWTTCGTGIRSQRTLRIKNINRPDCDAEGDRIDDLEIVLAGVEGIDLESLAVVAGDGCKDDYTVDQLSVDCLDEACLTENVTFFVTL